MDMSVTKAVASACILAAAAMAQTGCAAMENKATSGSSTSTETSVIPRTDATAPPPDPLPSETGRQPVGDASLEIYAKGNLGTILVDGTKRTLYAFSNDRPNDPTCYDACAQTWLPLLGKGDPAGGVGINDAETGTVERRDGTKQVTYKGIPLYQYAGDEIDSDAKGQGLDLFGGQWHVLTKDGVPLA
jgi:predicted lipoprotein with Yx(FWY)xxD motif